MAPSIITLSIIMHSIRTLSIMTTSIITLILMTLSIPTQSTVIKCNEIRHYDKEHNDISIMTLA